MLRRRLTLIQAVSLNMGMMVGIGPFITLPLFIQALHGPHAMLGWLLGAVVALADGLVWSELAAALPGSGGTYHFFDVAFGKAPIGRLLRFLFVWEFLLSGPLELASGAIGLAQYAGFIAPALKVPAWSIGPADAPLWAVTRGQVFGVGVMALIVILAYRKIEEAGALMVVLWLGMLATLAWVIGAGLSAFDPGLAFDLPPDAWRPPGRVAFGLGVALGYAMYSYFGYYQVCYLGDEVKDPARTIPRAIAISVVAVAALYVALTAAVLGVVPWREVERSQHVVSDFMALRSGPVAAKALTWLILWTAATSLYAGLLGYARVPFAAARAGHFYRPLAATHPTQDFPHRALLLIGALTAFACLFDLSTVLGALLASRILVQFLGQIAVLAVLRRRPAFAASMPFRMPLYPLPALVALAGWIYVYATLETRLKLFGLVTVTLGSAAFFAWDRGRRRQNPGSQI